MTARNPQGQPLRNTDPPTTVECVGTLEVRVELAAASAEAAERWSRRAEALAAWMVAEWRAQGRAANEGIKT